MNKYQVTMERDALEVLAPDEWVARNLATEFCALRGIDGGKVLRVRRVECNCGAYQGCDVCGKYRYREHHQAASATTLAEGSLAPFMADLTLAEMWNEAQNCADPHIAFGLLVFRETMRQVKERGVAPAVAQPLTDEQIIREFYIHTVMDDEPLFTFDRKSALELARALLEGKGE